MGSGSLGPNPGVAVDLRQDYWASLCLVFLVCEMRKRCKTSRGANVGLNYLLKKKKNALRTVPGT